MSPQREPQTDPPKPHEPSPHPIFGIPEILEFIFLYLDMRDLLVSVNRVSRLWHHVVNETPSLRQILHFDPISMQDLSGPMERDGTNPCPGLVPNALVAFYFGPCFFYKDPEDDFSSITSDSYESIIWDISPMPCEAENFYAMRWTPWNSSLPWSTPVGVRQAFTRSGASWRGMLVSQPPPPRLSCVWNPQINTSCFPTTRVVKKTETDSIDSAGLRMGQLYDFVQYRLPSSHSENRLSMSTVYWNHIPDDEPVDQAGMARTLLKKLGLVVLFRDYEHLPVNDHRDDWEPDYFNMRAFNFNFRSQDAPIDQGPR